MSAVSGTRRGMKELVDGTIRVQIDIDPQFRDAFLREFSRIDMPVAIAPLLPGAAPMADAPHDERNAPTGKGGELARLAGMLCASEEFRAWFWAQSWWTPQGGQIIGANFDEEETAEMLRQVCGVSTRALLDHDTAAAARFHELIRKPYKGIA